MEKHKLPNATAVLVLGILSILTCCCYGIGIILGIVALVLAKKDMALYLQEPEKYTDYNNLNIGRILAIIGVSISAVFFIILVYSYAFIGEEGMREFQQNLEDKIEYEQQQ